MSFTLGQKVTISDSGFVYAFCDPAAEQFGLKRYLPGQGIGTPDGSKGTVVAEPAFFPDGDCILLGVSLDDGYDVVVDPAGVSA